MTPPGMNTVKVGYPVVTLIFFLHLFQKTTFGNDWQGWPHLFLVHQLTSVWEGIVLLLLVSDASTQGHVTFNILLQKTYTFPNFTDLFGTPELLLSACLLYTSDAADE